MKSKTWPIAIIAIALIVAYANSMLARTSDSETGYICKFAVNGTSVQHWEYPGICGISNCSKPQGGFATVSTCQLFIQGGNVK
jgi:hypothetical protein